MGLLYSHYEANPITNNNLKINAVSGTLCKTFRKSYFVRFQQDSLMEHFYFNEDTPLRIIDKDSREFFSKEDKFIYKYYEDYYYKLKQVVILQIMLCAENNFLIEAIDKEDYDELFNTQEK